MMKALVPMLGLLSAMALAQTTDSSAIAGDWNGTLDTGAQRLRIAVHVARAPDGALSAKFDSLDQGALGIAVDAVRFDAGLFSFQMARLTASFSGRLSPDGQRIEGTFQQGPGRIPLVLIRGAVMLNRPQEPKPPLPYASEDVSYAGGAPDVTMAGTLTIPTGTGPFPAIFLITGSGPQDRDEALMGHRPFLVLADRLTRAGIVVLRADDRGVAKSTGNFALATTMDFADDAAAAVRYLLTRPEVARTKIGLVGHSEGGLIAPIVASRTKDVSFLVLLAAPAVPGSDLLLKQQETLLAVAGASQAVIDARAKMFKAAYDEMAKGGGSPQTLEQVDRIFAEGGMSAEERQLGMTQLQSPWLQAYLRLDPATYLKQVTVPVLALNGSLDTQVDARQNLPALRAATAGNHDATIEEVPAVNHLFQHATTGSPNEYATIEETMSPDVLSRIADWIVKHTR